VTIRSQRHPKWKQLKYSTASSPGFIGTKHERDIKKLQPVIADINAREAEVQSLSDEGLKARLQNSALRSRSS